MAPPSLYLQYVIDKLPSNVTVAGQNCYKAEKGAFTGEIRFVVMAGQKTTKYVVQLVVILLALRCCLILAVDG